VRAFGSAVGRPRYRLDAFALFFAAARTSTVAKRTQPTTKQTTSMAREPSSDFLPVRPSLTEATSPPNDTPMIAALMSPSTRKSSAAVEMDGGEMDIVAATPRPM